MNDAHFHLAVNHLPIIFPIVGIIVMATGLIFKSEPIKRTAFFIFILGALAAFFAMNSGEAAEEFVEHLDGVSENRIKNHEESAEFFSVLAYLLGGLSVLGIWSNLKKKSFSNAIAIGTLLYALAVIFFARQTATTGGEIMHPEIRSTNQSAPTTTQNADHLED